MKRPERAVAVLVLAAAALLLAPRRSFVTADCAFGEATYQEAGEGLLHGAAGGTPPSYHMPAASLAAACLRGHASSDVRRTWLGLAQAGPLVLAAAVAGASGGAAAAAAAAALLAWTSPEPACHPQAAMALLVLVLAGALAAWSRRTDSARSWAVAAALGASFAFRSTWAFLPPLLALWALRRGARKSALIVGLAPYLAIAPWAAATLASEGRPSLFEAGQAGDNIIAGALGLVGTFEGDSSALADGLPDPMDFGETMSWAARETLSNPFRTLDAMFRRAVFVVALAPLPWACALVGCLAAWRRPQVRAWALLALYLVAVHVPMSVQANYFTPLWPVLALLAAAPLAHRRFGFTVPLERGLRRLGSGLVLMAGAAALVAGSAAMVLAARYGAQALSRAPDSEAALEAALAAAPDDAVLRLWRGRRLLRAGSLAEARADFQAAVAGGVDRAEPLAAWSGLLSGGTLDMKTADGLPCATRALSVFFGAEALALQGRQGAAQAAALEAVEARRACAFVRVGAGAAQARLKATAQAVRALLADLAPLVPRGRVLAAPRLLTAAFSAFPPDRESWLALAIGLQDLADSEGAVAAHDGMAEAGAAASPADRGVALVLAGRRDEGRAALTAALAADPACAPAALSLGAVLEGDGKPAEARAVYERALAAGGGRLRGELKRRLGPK
ncbi:MAG: hypothetical protein HYZ75_19375 [Elusimicrobia bacterium]|nr:hypothetical protein [Elusimicrobiota bacterium]